MPTKKEKEAKKAEKEKKQKKTEKQKLSQNEYEKKVIELAKLGMTSEKIGEALRKQGIHSKEHEKEISSILKENKLYHNPDLKNIEKKLERLEAHYKKNKQDKRAMRERERVFSQLRRLKEYFKI